MRNTSVSKLALLGALLCCLLLAGTAFAQTTPFGYLDSAADSNGNTTIPATGTLIVRGWAADNTDFAPVGKGVQIFIDGKLAGNATVGIARPDVAAAFGDAYLNSGYSASISMATYGAGTHSVTAVATNSASVTGTLSNTKSITVTAVDYAASNVVVTGTAVAGSTIQVSDTTTNVGQLAGTVYSTTRYYLSATQSKSSTILGVRQVAPLAGGAASIGAKVTVTVPAGSGGAMYVVACANDTNTVGDGNTSNNCSATPITITGADLAETSTVPTLAFTGTTIQASDKATNVGTGVASSSMTRYYLNTAAVKGGSVLAARTISNLAANASSTTATINLNLSSTLTGGQYFIVACANDTNTVVDSNTSNNCVASPISIYVASKTIVVDPTKAASAYDPTTCGTATAACKTIVDGVTRATAGQTVLVYPGTYVEQVTITKNITLASAVKNQAIIQAPATTKLTADADGHQTLVTVTGGTTATVKDMTVAGPVFSTDCNDNFYGVYVKNANATIVGNTIDKIQHSNPALWGCQPGVGIRFGSKALGYVGHNGTIDNNVVIAPAKGGIVVDGDNTTVNVTNNTVSGLNVTGVVGQNGIQISRGANGTVDGNTISNFKYGATLAQLSAAGILIYNPGLVTATNNNVSGSDEGISVYHDPKYVSGAPDFTTQFATKAVIKKNNASNNVYLGIHIDPFSTGNTIWNNTVLGNTGGYDELDEHPDFSSNNWGTQPSEYNTIGTAFAGLVFTY